MNAKEISLLARRLLIWAGISTPPVDVYKIADKAGIEVYEAPLLSVSGVCFRSEGRIAVVLRSFDYPVRKRFTLAHELGHCFLKHKKTQMLAQKQKRRTEKEADRFAASLLMPEDWLIDDIEPLLYDPALIEKLAEKYEVSTQSVEIRLKELHLYQRWKHQKLHYFPCFP